ncbi:hypothetical protein [Streptomyces sp. 8N706]|uniref:hypothetical protein n=1 Tax=Streptomyces sp. 8N706 TaxID=3457416 RepID=UPI003FD002E8
MGFILDRWLSVADWEEESRDRTEDLIRLYIRPTFRKLKATKLSAEALELFYGRCAAARNSVWADGTGKPAFLPSSDRRAVSSLTERLPLPAGIVTDRPVVTLVNGWRSPAHAAIRRTGRLCESSPTESTPSVSSVTPTDPIDHNSEVSQGGRPHGRAARRENIARFVDFVAESLLRSAEQAREVLSTRSGRPRTTPLRAGPG